MAAGTINFHTLLRLTARPPLTRRKKSYLGFLLFALTAALVLALAWVL